MLRPGREYLVRPWVIDDEPVRATFTGPTGGWTWRGDLATRTVDHTPPQASDPRRPYAGVGVMVADRVPVDTCDEATVTWTPLSDDPVVAAQQIGAGRGVEVLETPRAETRFGHHGAHLRIRVTRLCATYQDRLLWALGDAGWSAGFGVAKARVAGQAMDVWVLDVEGTRVVVWSETSPGVPATWAAQASAMLDSLRVEPE
jgi:hypothetical protein